MATLLKRAPRMSTDTADGPTAAAPSPSIAQKKAASIKLVSYPKVVFLYPLFLVSLVAAIWVNVVGGQNANTELVTVIWLCTFALNLAVMSFDFPRTTSLTLFCALFGAAMGLLLLYQVRPEWFPGVFDFVGRLKPFASGAFYWCITGVLAALFLTVFINRRFDYWEVRPNELLHHHGVLSNLKRYSAPNLQIEKEIDDVFEYALLRSGTLILHPRNEPRSIVLENVPNITRKEAEITRMLSALQVSVRDDA